MGSSFSARGDFFSFLSSAYGTGDVTFDLLLVAGVLCAALLFVAVLQTVALGRWGFAHEETALERVSQLLYEMHVQLNELRSSVVHEFEKYRGELGYVQQELRALRPQANRRPGNDRATRGGNSLEEFFANDGSNSLDTPMVN